MDILVFVINKVVISGLVIGSVYALGAVGTDDDADVRLLDGDVDAV